jgi:hypothetical protein
MEKLGTLYVPVAPVMGTTPLKFNPPSKKEYVTLIALKCTGVIK